MTLQTLSLAAQLSLWSHLTDSVQSFMSSCITSQECQTHLIWPTWSKWGLFAQEAWHIVYYLFIYISEASHTCWEQMQSKQGKQYPKPQPIQELLFLFQCRKICNSVLLQAFTSQTEMWKYTLLLVLACYPKLRYSHFHLQKISGIQGINLKVLKQTLQSLFFIADNPAYSLQLFKCHSICEVCWNGFFRL